MKKDMLFVFLLLVLCTVYDKGYDKGIMSNGQIYDHWKGRTVATWAYPLGTKLEVSYGTKKIEVVVTDRMNKRYKKDGRLDLSGYAMYYLTGSWQPTVIHTKVRVIDSKDKKEGTKDVDKPK